MSKYIKYNFNCGKETLQKYFIKQCIIPVFFFGVRYANSLPLYQRKQRKYSVFFLRNTSFSQKVFLYIKRFFGLMFSQTVFVKHKKRKIISDTFYFFCYFIFC